MKHNADVLKAGSISVVIPAIGLLMGLGLPGILILDYVHVLLAAIWTGTDAFLGFIFYIVISGMDDDIRYYIGKRLLPMTMFFIPAVSVIVPVAGYALAVREGIFSMDLFFMVILILSAVLIILSYVLILPNAFFIYGHDESSKGLISRKLWLISITASVQLVLQIIMISLMAYIVVFS